MNTNNLRLIFLNIHLCVNMYTKKSKQRKHMFCYLLYQSSRCCVTLVEALNLSVIELVNNSKRSFSQISDRFLKLGFTFSISTIPEDPLVRCI